VVLVFRNLLEVLFVLMLLSDRIILRRFVGTH
jgi:hypothetical protein